jgi:PAS domain-containing protein
LGVTAFIVWRKWIAPWQQVEDVITQIGRGERPRTFLMEGSAPAQRIGFQLEKIVGDLEQLQKQIAKRESGMQTIFSAMQDALLVVDSNRQVIVTNQTFRKLFDAPEILLATPLLEIVRDPTLDRISGIRPQRDRSSAPGDGPSEHRGVRALYPKPDRDGPCRPQFLRIPKGNPSPCAKTIARGCLTRCPERRVD